MGSLQVLLHLWSYDFYDMGYFTDQLDGHVINYKTILLYNCNKKNISIVSPFTFAASCDCICEGMEPGFVPDKVECGNPLLAFDA